MLLVRAHGGAFDHSDGFKGRLICAVHGYDDVTQQLQVCCEFQL